MKLANYPRVVGELLVVGFVAAWLLAREVFAVRVDQWPPVARYAAMAGAVVAITAVTMRLAYQARGHK